MCLSFVCCLYFVLRVCVFVICWFVLCVCCVVSLLVLFCLYVCVLVASLFVLCFVCWFLGMRSCFFVGMVVFLCWHGGVYLFVSGCLVV